MILQEVLAVVPELIILTGALTLLMLSVFIKERALESVNTATVIIVAAALIAVVVVGTTKDLLFYNQLINDIFARFSKIILLSLSLILAVSNRDFLKKDKINLPEYSVLILLSLVGMMIMVSAQSFLSLFMGLELQSLSLYVLTAIRRDDLKSSEAGVKYFLLGSLATGIMLYGMTFIYGAVGSVGFSEIKLFLTAADLIPLGFYMGMIFIIAGTVFKISVVPFHMWAPDVYEGAPTTVVSFFASIPKVAAFCMITRLLMDPLLSVHSQWQYIIAALAVATMIIGVFGALYQKNIKRLLAYSSIMNMGYALLGWLAGNSLGVESSLIYVVLYSLSVLGFFICLLLVNRRGQEIQNVSDLAGLFRVAPGIAFAMVFLLFSFAGVPPLAGFLGKLYIFKSVLQADMLWVGLIGIFVSVLAAGYYLYIIKVIIMDEPSENVMCYVGTGESTTAETGSIIATAFIIGGLFWFFIKPEFFIKLAVGASKGLF